MPLSPSLDPEQKLAVTAPDGAVLVFAGAGSGKTRIMTSRIDWLMSRGAQASGILTVTFTRRAAELMRRRLDSMLSSDAPRGDLRIGTFHSLMAHMLRNEDPAVLAHLARTTNFSVWDEEDRVRAVERLLKGQDYTGDLKAIAIAEQIGRWKNEGLSPDEVQEAPTSERDLLVGRLWELYEETLTEANAFDFDDIPHVPLRLAQVDPALRERWAGTVKHLLVEEFQDLNVVQTDLVELLSSVHGNLYAVGDDMQSIEGRSGARPEYLRDFSARYPGAHQYRLVKNYRSSTPICDLANSILTHATPPGEPIEAVNGVSAPKPSFRRLDSERAEARFLAAEIRRLGAAGTSPRDIAVLIRSSVMAAAIEDALNETGLDYRILGSLAYFSRREVRDAVAWLRLILNPRDEAAARRALAVPGGRGIGEVLVAEVERSRGDGDWVSAFATVAEGSAGTGKGRNSLRTMAAQLTEWAKAAATESPQDLVNDVLEHSGLLDAVDDGTDEGEFLVENLQDLASIAKTYRAGDLARFLDRAATDSESANIGSGPAELITIATIHAAKGLEWKAVFLAGCEEGLLPRTAEAGALDLEAERRLFYVGVTRAKQRLMLTASTDRLIGNERDLHEVSRFVHESREHLAMDAGTRPDINRPAHPPRSSLQSKRLNEN